MVTFDWESEWCRYLAPGEGQKIPCSMKRQGLAPFKHGLKCSRFSEIRIALFDHVRKSCPRIDTLNDENKFIYLLNSSGSTIKEVAKFLHSAYTARSA